MLFCAKRYVYLIQDFIDPLIVKFGRSAIISQRLKSYPTGAPLVTCLRVHDSTQLERYVLQRMRHDVPELCLPRRDLVYKWFEVVSKEFDIPTFGKRPV